MQNLGKVTVITLGLMSGCVWAESVKATVSSTQIVSGESVQLYLKATGGGADFPKIVMIDDAPIVGRSNSSSRNVSIINGDMKNESTTTQILQFVPKHDMTIPSYTVTIGGKAYQTDPIAIKVVKASAVKPTSDALFSLELRATKNSVMVGESLMVTGYFSLKNGVKLNQEVQYTAPTFSGFLVTQGTEKNAYRKGNYQVQEIQYILTPQREGNFTISPAQAKIGMPDRSRRDIFGMTFGTQWKQTTSNSLTIEVLPQAQPSDIVGDFTVNTTIDAQEVKANKPVNLTVKIEGEGNLESFELSKYEIEGVTIYSDEAKVETKIINGQLHSTYIKSFAFISESDFTIPSRSFSMFSPKEKALKSLEIKGFDVKVKAPTNSTIPSHNVVQSNMPLVPTKEVTVEKTVEVKSVAWWMLLLSFAGGVVSVFGVRALGRIPSNPSPYKESEALKILYAHISTHADIEEMVRKLYARKNGDKSVEIDKKVLREMVERVG